MSRDRAEMYYGARNRESKLSLESNHNRAHTDRKFEQFAVTSLSYLIHHGCNLFVTPESTGLAIQSPGLSRGLTGCYQDIAAVGE
jgi:hypothetical protein